jgi:hypothetical protein
LGPYKTIEKTPAAQTLRLKMTATRLYEPCGLSLINPKAQDPSTLAYLMNIVLVALNEP